MAGDGTRAEQFLHDLATPMAWQERGASAVAFVGRRAVVTVPATCANLGPGFDCLALAICLTNRFTVAFGGDESILPGSARVEVIGKRTDVRHLSHGADNLFVRAFKALCEHVGVRMPGLTVRTEVNLPPGRGLGSSATAVVAGVLAANILLGEVLSRAALLDLAVSCEPGHHADNVAAAFLGGLVVTGAHDAEGRLLSLALPVPPALRAVLFVPEMPMSTTHSRTLLPATYSRSDAAFNVSHVALLLAALQCGRVDLLRTAMDDRLHQPYRERLFPALQPLIAAAQAAGALGACLSGGGSSVLALASDGAERVRAAMELAACQLGVPGYGVVTEIARDGALCRLEVDEAERVLAPQGVSDE